MIVNAQVKAAFDAIALSAQSMSNTKLEHYKYIRRYVKVFVRTLTEEEQVYLMITLMDMLHHKNVLTDPATLNDLNNIKVKNVFLYFILSCCGAILIAALFFNNSSLNGTIEMFKGLIELFSL